MANFLVNSSIFITSHLNLRFIQLIGLAVGNIIYFIPNHIKKTVKINLYSSNLTKEVVNNDLIKRSLVELARWFLELGPMWTWSTERLEALIVQEEGADDVHKCLNNGQSALIITPHHGNWELNGLTTSRRFPLTIMYKPPAIPALGKHMRAARTRAGAKLVGIDRNALKAMISALKSGEAVGMLPDQEPKDGAYVYAPFLGQSARTMTLFNKLVRKSGAAVFMSTMKRLPKGQGYALKYTRLPDTLGSEDEEEAATALNKAVEDVILDCPEQYLWAYKRFKFPEDGGENIYER